MKIRPRALWSIRANGSPGPRCGAWYRHLFEVAQKGYDSETQANSDAGGEQMGKWISATVARHTADAVLSFGSSVVFSTSAAL